MSEGKFQGTRHFAVQYSRLVRNASKVSIGTPPPSVELGGPGWRFYLWQTRKRDRRLGRTSSMTCTLAPDPCSQNRAVKAPMSARAVTAAQLNTGHHLSKRVPCHPVWPRPVACSQGTSTVLSGDDLKSKLGGLPADAKLRTPGLFLFPDLSLLTYFRGPSAAGSVVYNVMHNYALPCLLGIVAAPLHSALLGELSLIRIAHASMDRMLGYGLKTRRLSSSRTSKAQRIHDRTC